MELFIDRVLEVIKGGMSPAERFALGLLSFIGLIVYLRWRGPPEDQKKRVPSSQPDAPAAYRARLADYANWRSMPGRVQAVKPGHNAAVPTVRSMGSNPTVGESGTSIHRAFLTVIRPSPIIINRTVGANRAAERNRRPSNHPHSRAGDQLFRRAGVRSAGAGSPELV
jgi:hypothetical protein